MKIVHGPRPKGKIHPERLPEYEASGEWCAQRKFNGSKTTFSLCDGKLEFLNKGTPFKKWRPPASMLQQFSALKTTPGHTYWFDAELLDLRVPNTVVIYDVLQANRYLIGKQQVERLQLLDELCGKPRQRCDLGIALEVTENIWMAEWWEQDFPQHYQEFLHLDIIEGLVLRRKASKLDNYGREAYETDAQLRCRKGAKNYRF